MHIVWPNNLHLLFILIILLHILIEVLLFILEPLLNMITLSYEGRVSSVLLVCGCVISRLMVHIVPTLLNNLDFINLISSIILIFDVISVDLLLDIHLSSIFVFGRVERGLIGIIIFVVDHFPLIISVFDDHSLGGIIFVIVVNSMLFILLIPLILFLAYEYTVSPSRAAVLNFAGKASRLEVVVHKMGLHLSFILLVLV